MQSKLRLRFAAILVTMMGVAIIWLSPGQSIQAQLSCDFPPSPFDDADFLASLQRVWDKTDFCVFQEGVFSQIISGGVPRDGIPPIDDPTFDTVEAAWEWLQPQSPVIAVEINGSARAYPLAILTRHEIVNDELNGTPIAVTYCPLCNSAIAYDRRVDGEVYRFGVSGLLRNSDLVMWDDVTQSWWQQFTGEGLVGIHTDDLLEIVASQVVGFSAFVEQYPAGEVLSPGSGSYDSNPYVEYDSNPNPFLFRGELDERLFSTSRVLAGLIGGEAIAYPFETLEEEIVINDAIGDLDVVAFWQPGATSALDERIIDSSRDVGMAALFYRELDDGQILTFSADEDGTVRDDQTGSVWNMFGTAIDGELAGSQLWQAHAFPHFWFAWAAFQPETVIYGQ